MSDKYEIWNEEDRRVFGSNDWGELLMWLIRHGRPGLSVTNRRYLLNYKMHRQAARAMATKTNSERRNEDGRD